MRASCILANSARLKLPRRSQSAPGADATRVKFSAKIGPARVAGGGSPPAIPWVRGEPAVGVRASWRTTGRGAVATSSREASPPWTASAASRLSD